MQEEQEELFDLNNMLFLWTSKIVYIIVKIEKQDICLEV
jgi:hypothetical protein